MSPLQREVQRIEFRRDLMSVPGGVEWLTHVARLFDHREQSLGPGDFGLPRGIRIALHKRKAA